MIRSSIGQWNNGLASQIYRLAGRQVDALIATGKIAASDRNGEFAKIVAKRLSQSRLPIPQPIAAAAGSGSGSAVSGTATSAAELVRGGVSASAKSTAVNAAKATSRAAAPIALAFFVAEGAHTLYKYKKGEIDGAEAGRRTAESAGTNAGGLGGAVAGAALGSAILPGVGTVIGGIVGGMGGGMAVRKLVRSFTR